MNFTRVLSDDDVARLHEAAEDLLRTTGFRVTHPGLLKKASTAGMAVDVQEGRVRVPTPLLRELLAQAPDRFRIAWEPGREITIGQGVPYCNAIVTDPWIIDYDTREPRRPCLADLRRHSIIAQNLESVVTCGRMEYPVTDVDDATSSLRALEEHLLYYAKHYAVYPASLESFRQWLRIGEIVGEGNGLALNDLMSVAVAVVSPLVLTDMNAELLLDACAHGLPVIPTICPMAGATAPYSHAATLLLGHAENLFLSVLTQVIAPGNPFLYAFGPSVTDMRTGRDLYYTLDKVLWKIAGVQLARATHLPVATECGGAMTHRYDAQTGAEGMLFMLAARASGADLLCGIGSCHNAVGMSAEMMVLQTEWFSAAEFLAEGFSTDEVHLGLDSLKQAGPGGNFLTDALTLDLLRHREFFSSAMLDLAGEFGKSPSILERAHEKVEQMVAHPESPLPGEVRENLHRFFDAEYRKLLV